MGFIVRNHTEHCLVHINNERESIFRDHRVCPIANQELYDINGDEKRGGCRRCNRSHHDEDPNTKCRDDWYVCVKCYPTHCALYKSREPELVEAKRGEVIWL